MGEEGYGYLEKKAIGGSNSADVRRLLNSACEATLIDLVCAVD